MPAWERFGTKKSPDAAQLQKHAVPETDSQNQMMADMEDQEQMTKIQERIQANRIAAIRGMSPRSQESYAFVDSPNKGLQDNSPKALHIPSGHISPLGLAGGFHQTLI